MSPKDVHMWRAVKAERRVRTARAPGRVAAPVVTEQAVLAAVRAALVEGTAEIEVSDLAGRLGVVAAKVKATVDALVANGALVEVKKRPRTFRLV